MTALTRRLKLLPGGTENDGLMPMTSLKVAFATSDMKSVNQHFGSAEAFALYEVSATGGAMIEAMQFGSLAQDGNEDKLVAKLTALEDCAAVYAQAVGHSAISQLRALEVQPIRVEAGTPIPVLVDRLAGELKASPPAWVSRALLKRGRNEERFDAMDEEGWDE